MSGELHKATVGMVGYPNVGKSSTINALFGGKKVAVAATPGKTKHFQTLIVHDDLELCDCPGLVFPTFASSKADMVAAGVIPIDRLVNPRECLETVTARIHRSQWRAVYHAAVPRPPAHEDQGRAPTAAEVLRAVCVSRGWLNPGSGVPDETRCGRAILKDYVDGKVLHIEWPPTQERPAEADLCLHPAVAAKLAAGARPSGEPRATGEPARGPGDAGPSAPAGAPGAQGEEGGVYMARASGHTLSMTNTYGVGHAGGKAARRGKAPPVAPELAEEMAAMGIEVEQPKQKRPDYKFNKKQQRTKGQRGKGAYGIHQDGMGDGMGVAHGKKGGIVRVGGYEQTY